MKISIIVPVYNERGTIETLLKGLCELDLPLDQKEIIVVESNSTDGSREAIAKFHESHPQASELMQVIYQTHPRGKGNAVRAGLRVATGDVILIQDGDLEYDLRDYARLLEPIRNGKTKVVLGSRHMAAPDWQIRTFATNPLLAFVMNLGGRFFHSLFNVVYGCQLTDPTTMYKVFHRECIEGVEFFSDRFDFDYELLAALLRLGHKVIEIPITYKSRSFSEGKKINILRDPWTWIAAIFRYRFKPISRVKR